MHEETKQADFSKRSAWLFLLGLTLILCLVVGPAPDALSREIMVRVGSLKVASVILMTYLLLGLSLIYWAASRFLRARGFSSVDLGLSLKNQRKGAVVVAVLWGALLGIGFFFSYRDQFGHPEASYTDWSLLRLFLMIVGFGVAALEELIGRGLVFAMLRRAGHGTFVQVAVSSLMMAIYHSAWTLELITFSVMCVQGLIFSLFFLWGRRTLLAAILAHGVAHLVGDPWATYLIIETALGGPSR